MILNIFRCVNVYRIIGKGNYFWFIIDFFNIIWVVISVLDVCVDGISFWIVFWIDSFIIRFGISDVVLIDLVVGIDFFVVRVIIGVFVICFCLDFSDFICVGFIDFWIGD